MALFLALASCDECEHLEYVLNDQVLGQDLLDWGVETVYLGILMIHYNTAVYIIYCLMLLLHSFNTVLHWQNKGMTINNL